MDVIIDAPLHKEQVGESITAFSARMEWYCTFVPALLNIKMSLD